MKITRRQLRRLIREVGRSEHAAEARGMAASYQRGYSDGAKGLRLGQEAGRDPEYRRGYEKGVADGESRGQFPRPSDFSRLREAEGSTKKYDDDSALKGGQSKLPDGLQKGIIDKTVEDREETEAEEREEKNESARITRRQLRRIVKEVIEGPDGVWYDDHGNRLQPDESAPWGTYAEQGDESYSDVIIMSPNGDSVLVNGQETYAQDVPSELLLASGFPLPAPVASKLVREIEQQFAAGYVELGIEYKNGQWSW